jgi:hypothetical protein
MADSHKTGNAAFAFEQDLVDLKKYARVDLRTSDTMELANDCFMLAREHWLAGVNGEDPVGPGEAFRIRDALEGCVRLRYLVVIKLLAVKSTDYIDAKRFGAGGVEAEAHVFDLGDGRHAGGVGFTARSSDRTYDPSADLRTNFYNALEDALSEKLPDAKL